MAQQTEVDRLRSAWRALVGGRGGDGWRTIPLELNAPCRLLAGRHFPGDSEAVLVGFRGVRMPPESQLPQGQGFEVARLSSDQLGGTHSWVGLSRRDGGDLDLFARMAGDVVRLLEECATMGEDGLFRHFLARIHAWQQFMSRSTSGLLGPEAEVGLFGEVQVLNELLVLGMPAEIVLEAWQGPLDGVQDFMIGTGALEVKATLASKGFLANISSLEQLDETLRQPLFVAGVRLALGSIGMTLPGVVAMVWDRLKDITPAQTTFELRLAHAGYMLPMADRYTRRFVYAGTIVLPVSGDFPRLTRSNVTTGVRTARYEVDLDVAANADVGLLKALEILGGL